MSDAFMAAAVLMVAAPLGAVSRITNIANQRLKESNRILAVVTELGKLGVVARERPDGLEVEGVGALAALKPAVIACHDDHRLAMAFAVLGCRVPGLVISDRRCVAKTYPAFWDDLQKRLGIAVMLPTAEQQQQARAVRAAGTAAPAAELLEATPGMRSARR